MRTITINKNDGGQRLDKFLGKCIKGLPAALMYKYLRKKRIKLNGKRAEGSDILKEGDVVTLFIPDEFTEDKKKAEDIPLTKPNLSVIYEDENILLLSKRAGQLVHDGDGDDGGNTLIRHLKSYLIQKGEYRPEEENSFAPALCNRIDRNTGGIVIAAKTAEALRAVNEAIRDNKTDKRYLCVLHGRPEKERDICEAHLFKNTKTKTVRVSASPTRGSKPIKTGYRIIDYNKNDDLSLAEVRLYTGRTHQIRAHMAYLGYPLLGEGKYGVNRDDRRLSYKHQALYSYKLTFGTDSGLLAYLNKRSFCVSPEEIRFLELFREEKYRGLFNNNME